MANVHIDLSKAISDLKAHHRSLSEKKINRAIVSALNHTIGKSRTSITKKLRQTYGASSRDIKKKMRIRKANFFDHSAEIKVSIRPLPLRAFRPRQNKRGVSIRIKGKSRLINKAFIAVMPSGHKGVFARGHYEKGKFRFRKKRKRKKGNDLEINELFTASVHNQMQDSAVSTMIRAQVQKDFPIRLKHLLSRS